MEFCKGIAGLFFGICVGFTLFSIAFSIFLLLFGGTLKLLMPEEQMIIARTKIMSCDELKKYLKRDDIKCIVKDRK